MKGVKRFEGVIDLSDSDYVAFKIDKEDYIKKPGFKIFTYGGSGELTIIEKKGKNFIAVKDFYKDCFFSVTLNPCEYESATSILKGLSGKRGLLQFLNAMRS